MQNIKWVLIVCLVFLCYGIFECCNWIGTPEYITYGIVADNIFVPPHWVRSKHGGHFTSPYWRVVVQCDKGRDEKNFYLWHDWFKTGKRVLVKYGYGRVSGAFGIWEIQPSDQEITTD